MNLRHTIEMTFGILLATVSFATADYPLRAVPFADVTIDDAFWTPRMEVNRRQTIPYSFEMSEKTGRIANFAKAAGLEDGNFGGIFYDDSDVYKLIEAVAYSLKNHPDSALQKRTDAVIDLIAAAQWEDGYLFTFYSLPEHQPEKRFSDVAVEHELYCAGHLFEAAAAYYQVTGKRKLLDAALRFADHIDSVFGPDKRRDAPGHQEVEIGLVKLYRLTGQEQYLKLARFFLDQRGHGDRQREFGRWFPSGRWFQEHKPVVEQREAVGHTVRALYMYTAMTDVAALTGDRQYLEALRQIFDDMLSGKLFITGGAGAAQKDGQVYEAFETRYQLPNTIPDVDTCTEIAMAFWAHRMNLIEPDGRYGDLIERVLYNRITTGVSSDGKRFFYGCPLRSSGPRSFEGSGGQMTDGLHHRPKWFGTACCPPNVARFMPTLGEYLYAYDSENVYVSQYMAGEAQLSIGEAKVTLTQETDYPWDGNIKITVQIDRPTTFAMHVRIPGWCRGGTWTVNGKSVQSPKTIKGYDVVKRQWQSGDVVELNLPMPIERIKADWRVASSRGRVALMRGPVVYCLEGCDHDGHVLNLSLPRDAKLTAEHRDDLLGGVTVIRGTALGIFGDRPQGTDRVYFPQQQMDVKEVQLTAVPFCVWDNRDPGEMTVWLPELPDLAEPIRPPSIAATAEVSVSFMADFVRQFNGPAALHNERAPRNSHDGSAGCFHWWPHKGTVEWAQYDFPEPTKVSAVEVYWFDDTGSGECRLPKSWRLLYRDGREWKPVSKAEGYGVRMDQFNRTTFDPVATEALRLEVQLPQGFASGILEWRVE